MYNIATLEVLLTDLGDRHRLFLPPQHREKLLPRGVSDPVEDLVLQALEGCHAEERVEAQQILEDVDKSLVRVT